MNEQAGKLIRLILRRDRLRIFLWLVTIIVFVVAVAFLFDSAYGEDGERKALAETMKNPAIVALVGKGYGIDDYTIGAMMAHQMLLFTAVIVAIMSVLFVVRHTRTDEEAGRIELIRALPTGRLANLFAALVVAFSKNIILAVLLGFVLAKLPIESMDVKGSFVFSMAIGATGVIFSAITAICSQLAVNARAALGLSFALLGVAYLIRAIGDVTEEAISWLSPLGWILESQAYVNNHWGPILLTFITASIFTGIAFYLYSIRDLEAGFIPSRPGREHASFLLKSPFGLLFRIQRTGFITWLITMFIFGVSYGSVMGDLDDFFAENEMFQQMIDPQAGFTFSEQFVTMLMSVLAMIGTIPVILSLLKLMDEERKGRTELLVSQVVSRRRLLFSALILSFMTSFVMLTASGTGLWIAGTTVVEGGLEFGNIYTAAIVYLPAVWIMIGLTILFIGFIPRFTNVVWLYHVYSFFVVYLGGLFNFPEWMEKITPFGHIPNIPIEEMNYVAMIILTLIFLGFTIVGFIGYEHRDMEG